MMMMAAMTSRFQGTANRNKRVAMTEMVYPFPALSKPESDGLSTNQPKLEREVLLISVKQEKVKLEMELLITIVSQ